eukprot:4608256-Alexandrium_andersonii.AAC.1
MQEKVEKVVQDEFDQLDKTRMAEKDELQYSVEREGNMWTAENIVGRCCPAMVCAASVRELGDVSGEA